jgi:hypothetical protein
MQIETTAAELVFGDTTISVADLLPQAIAYLLQYGLSKSAQDAVAGVTKRVETWYETGCPEGQIDDLLTKAGLDFDDTRALSADDGTRAIVKALQAKRLESILAGTIGGGGSRGPRAVGLERWVERVAEVWLRERLAQLGRATPTGKAFTQLREDYIAKYRGVAPAGKANGLEAEADLWAKGAKSAKAAATDLVDQL